MLVAAFAAALTAGAAAALALAPAAADRFWGRGPGPWIPFLLSRASGPLPFSLIEVLVAAWIGLRLFRLGRGIAATPWRRAGPAGALALLRPIVRDLSIALVLFYALWGFGYACSPLETRLGWNASPRASAPGEPTAPRPSPDADRLAVLAARMVEEANADYVALHGSEDAGTPTTAADPHALEAAIEHGWRRAAAALRLPGPVTRRYGPAKRLVASPLLQRAGLSGFFSPFTGEANLNRSVPAVAAPQVLAHEKAHQRGVNREDEANFLGWLAAASSDDPLARYAAAVFAQRQLLRALIRADPERAKTLVEARGPGVQRDVDDLYRYWRVSEGRTGRLAERVNDAYLRGNRVADGVASYGRAVTLLLAWAGRWGGQLAPVPAEEPAVSSAPRTLRASESSVNGF